MPCITLKTPFNPRVREDQQSNGETFKSHVDRRRDRRRICINRSRWTQRDADSGVDAACRRERGRRTRGHARTRRRALSTGYTRGRGREEESDRTISASGFAEVEERSRRRRTTLASRHLRSAHRRLARIYGRQGRLDWFRAELELLCNRRLAYRVSEW
jgi:hypothetical protein